MRFPPRVTFSTGEFLAPSLSSSIPIDIVIIMLVLLIESLIGGDICAGHRTRRNCICKIAVRVSERSCKQPVEIYTVSCECTIFPSSLSLFRFLFLPLLSPHVPFAVGHFQNFCLLLLFLLTGEGSTSAELVSRLPSNKLHRETIFAVARRLNILVTES